MTVKRWLGIAALVTAACIAGFTALAHLSCIVLGASCYRAQLAPDILVQSAIDGTWLAPIATLVISSLFVLCALFALSAAKLIKPLPFLRAAIITISTLCLLRGAIILPLSLIFPDRTTTFAVIAGGIWFLTGLLFLFGYRWVRQDAAHFGEAESGS